MTGARSREHDVIFQDRQDRGVLARNCDGVCASSDNSLVRIARDPEAVTRQAFDVLLDFPFRTPGLHNSLIFDQLEQLESPILRVYELCQATVFVPAHNFHHALFCATAQMAHAQRRILRHPPYSHVASMTIRRPIRRTLWSDRRSDWAPRGLSFDSASP